ncbi:MAG: glycosyltransferase family 9 protein [Burkholderiaceae bacterium]
MTRALAQRRHAADGAPPRTAVLMRDVGIGDLVWHAPYFERVARTSAEGRVTLLVPPTTHARELLGHEPWVRGVIDFDRRPRRTERRPAHHGGLAGLLRLAARISEEPLDRVVMFTHRSLPAAFACWWAGVPQRLGYGTEPMQRWLLSRSGWIEPYRGAGVAAYWNATAMCRRHGWCDAPLVPRLTVRPDALARVQGRLAGLPRPLHALAIGTSEPVKQWGEARFAELCERLSARGDGVVMLGGPAEAALAQAILARIDPALRVRVAALTDAGVADSVAALSLAADCIGNDTGAANVAAAVGTPTWVVLGPRPPLEHDPQRLHMIRGPSLAAITVDEVVAQVLPEAAAARTPLSTA